MRLKFTDQQLEEQFLLLNNEKALLKMRAALIIGCLTYPPYAIGDYIHMSAPGSWYAVVARCLYAASLFGCFLLTYTSFWLRHGQTVITTVIILAGAIGMAISANAPADYSKMINVAVVNLYLFPPLLLRFYYSVITTVLMTVIVTVMLAAWSSMTGEYLMTYPLFLLNASLLAVYSSYMLERAQRNEFIAQRAEKQEHQRAEKLLVAVNEKNDQLESKVAELAHKNRELSESRNRANQIFSAFAEALPGTVLDEKYRLDQKIGAGGFGAVYRATHLGLKYPVAVKIFCPTGSNASEEALERFRLEGISACRVQHPNAISIIDSGISSSFAYLVMELLNGHSLAAELAGQKRLPVSRVAEVIVPVCDVLAHAHAVGIIHRDIKPDNIFLHHENNGEVVKVVDFGIAKLMLEENSSNANNLTATGSLIGTPAYMAPERLTGIQYDGRADVYSLGIMLYQMLSGELPFRAEQGNQFSIFYMQLSTPPRPLREIVPELSVDIEAIVLQALAKDPAMRPQPRELAQKLLRAIGITGEKWSSGAFTIDLRAEISPSVNRDLHNLDNNRMADPDIANDETVKVNSHPDIVEPF